MLGVACCFHLLGNEAYSAPVSLRGEIGLRHVAVPRKPGLLVFLGNLERASSPGMPGKTFFRGSVGSGEEVPGKESLPIEFGVLRWALSGTASEEGCLDNPENKQIREWPSKCFEQNFRGSICPGKIGLLLRRVSQDVRVSTVSG